MSSPIPSAPGDDQLGLRPKPADARPTSVVALSGLLKVQRRWLFAGSTVAAAPARTPADTPGVLTSLSISRTREQGVVVGKPRPLCRRRKHLRSVNLAATNARFGGAIEPPLGECDVALPCA
jgi:hypothetical protein